MPLNYRQWNEIFWIIVVFNDEREVFESNQKYSLGLHSSQKLSSSISVIIQAFRRSEPNYYRYLNCLYMWILETSKFRHRNHKFAFCEQSSSGDEHVDKIVDNVVLSMSQILTNWYIYHRFEMNERVDIICVQCMCQRTEHQINSEVISPDLIFKRKSITIKTLYQIVWER